MRTVGLIVVGCGVLYFLVATFWRGRSAPLPPLTDDQVRRIVVAPAHERGSLLSQLGDQLPRPNIQLLYVQAVPESSALVLAGESDSSDEESATHWLLPWPRLNRFLSTIPQNSATVYDVYAGNRYVHYVYPAHPEENHYLILTELAGPAGFGGWFRWVVLGISVLMGVGLWLSRDAR